MDMLGVRMSLWREDAGLRGDGHSSDTGQGQRSRLEGTPVQEGRLQGRSCDASPPVQFARQRRVRLRQAGWVGSVQV